MIGEMIGNHRVLSQIGRGGMGTVYQAEDTQLGRKVAIKILNPSIIARGGAELERFRAEARVQANLHHANVVTLYGFEPYGESYCMIMEYVEGKTLADLVHSFGPLPAHIVLMIAKQVLEGLGAAHNQGVVHRDLKPSNIILTAGGIAKVMDFGIAKVEGGKSLTATGALVGTVNYMSPEQVRGEAVDSRSDLYSFGVILFELLTGQVPFKEESDFSIMLHHVQTPPPPPTQLLPDIPSELEDIVLRCLNKPPERRFQSAGDILGALDAFEEQDRALGRGALYTRKVLANWVFPTVPPASSDRGGVPIAARERAAGHSVSGHSESSPLSAEISSMVATHPNRPSSKGLTGAVILLVVVLAGAGLTWYRMHRPPAHFTKDDADTSTAVSEQSALTLEDAGIQEWTGQGGRPSVEQAAAAAQSPDTTTLPGHKAVSSGKPGSLEPLRSRAETSVPSKAGGMEGTIVQPAIPAGFMIFLDLDQSSEPLPLAAAQALITDIVREAGHEVLSPGIVSASIRTALDRNDWAEVRRNGVGYLVLGTARASIEPQSAYGSIYYYAAVSLRLELVGMENGSVAATGSGDAKSRGSASAASALDEALLSAASEAARTMMRNFKKEIDR